MLVAPRLPGATSGALFEPRSSSGSSTQVLNPLVDIRSRLINRANVQVFTVESSAPAYWREIALEQFDGTQWTPTDGDPVRPATGQLADVDGGTTITQRITIDRLGGPLVPAAFAPVSTATDGLLYADDTQTLVVRSAVGLQSDQVIELTSARTDASPEQLRLATVDHAPNPGLYELPDDFPDEARELAEQVTAGATNPYDQALALQNWFRTEFTYDLSVQAGNSDDAIRQFLRIRRGYCEQFSATFAAMARSLGIPARVAIGFTPGELRDDGLYHVYDRHAHAWPEVWFDGIGWVSFEPTPGRGEPGAESHTGVPAAQDETRLAGRRVERRGLRHHRGGVDDDAEHRGHTAGRSAGRFDHDDGAGRGGLDHRRRLVEGLAGHAGADRAGRRVVDLDAAHRPELGTAAGTVGAGPDRRRLEPLVRSDALCRRAGARRSDPLGVHHRRRDRDRDQLPGRRRARPVGDQGGLLTARRGRRGRRAQRATRAPDRRDAASR